MVPERLTAQLLAGPPARDADSVAKRLLAIQGQDPRGFRLAVRARSRVSSASEIDRALTEERSLVLTWLNRGTLHLVHSEDYPWLQALLAGRLRTGVERRLAQLGVEPRAAERGVRAIERALASDGPLEREELRRRVRRARIDPDGQALIHLLALASIQGLIVRGPVHGKQHAFALVRDWLGEPARVDRDAALAELARRYLAGHGPAGERDLAYWTGLPLRDARAGFQAIAGELVERGDGLVALKRKRVAALPSPRLLGPFDPLLHGWTSRQAVLGRHEAAIVAHGMFRAFALAEGRAVGRWGMRGGRVDVEPLEQLPKEVSAALQRDAAKVETFFAG